MRMKYQMDTNIYFINYYYINQTNLTDDLQFTWVHFGAVIVTDYELSSDEEEDDYFSGERQELLHDD